ncbi:MAG: acyl--CoA ligase [Ruminococcus sp.]|nr:acyl--CoA ligase [Ruminococcus sp.]
MKRHLEYPECTIYELVQRTADKYPEYTAIDYFGKSISYKKFIAEIQKCAAALKAAGVKSGDAVSICMPNTPEAIYLFYAVNMTGAVANMIHPMSAENEIVRFVNLTESRIIFAVDLISDKIERVMEQCSGLSAVRISVSDSMPLHIKIGYTVTNKKKPPKSSIRDWKSFIDGGIGLTAEVHNGAPDDTAAILYSGGTTGRPKGIMLTNMNFNALALQSIEACGGLEAGMKMLSVMPVFHGFGLGVCIHTMMVLGGTAVLQPKFSAAEFHKLLFRYRPDIIAGVPAIYEAMIVNKSFDGKKLDFLKCIVSGGDSLAPSTKKKLNDMLAGHGCRVKVREGYGLTECVTGSCLMPGEYDEMTSVGLPYPDTFYKVIDKEGNELPAGEEGEIILRGPTVMKGYYKEPEETAATLKKRDDGHVWLHTGDIGCIGENGYVYFRQRLKRMIVSSGYNIYPQNLEEVISSHSEVVMCAVVGVPDQLRGERVRACVVHTEGADEEKLKAELMAMLRKEIAAYALPREILFYDSLPKTLVGKIAYNELKNAG